MTIALSCTDWLAILNVLIAFIGVSFAIAAFIEWSRLSKLRKQFNEFQANITADVSRKNLQGQKALTKLIACYNVSNPEARISLAQESVSIDPQVYNGYNTIGYAYMELDQIDEAIDAFKDAIVNHPRDPVGYFDIAAAYLNKSKDDPKKHRTLIIKYLRESMATAGATLDDVRNDGRFGDYLEQL